MLPKDQIRGAKPALPLPAKLQAHFDIFWTNIAMAELAMEGCLPTHSRSQLIMAGADSPSERPGTGSEQPLAYLLMRTFRALRGSLEEALRPSGFTMPQVAVMLALGRASGLSTAELARRAFVTPQAMGEVLAALQAKGFVIRRAHDSHGRILPAELTQAGLDARRLCHELLAQTEARMLSRLSTRERETLRTLLERCVESWHEEGDPGRSPAPPAPSRGPKARAEP